MIEGAEEQLIRLQMEGGLIRDEIEITENNSTTFPGSGLPDYGERYDGVKTIKVNVHVPIYHLGPISISENNVTIKASEKGLDGFDEVTVNVPESFKKKPLTVKNGGTYYASAYGCDGFDPVNADIVDKLKEIINQIPDIIDGNKDPTDLIGDDIPDDIADTIFRIWATPDRPHPISGGISVTGSTWPDDPDAPTRSVEHRIATRQYNGGWQHREEIWIDGVEVSHNSWNYFGGSVKNSNISHIDSVEKRYSERYDGYYLYVTYSRTNSDGSVTTLHISTNQASHDRMMPKGGKYKVETTSPTE